MPPIRAPTRTTAETRVNLQSSESQHDECRYMRLASVHV
jgi:hypothetical protein